MRGKEALSLEEFATAPRKSHTIRSGELSKTIRAETERGIEGDAGFVGEAGGEDKETSTEASKALRRMKRDRMKGSSHFVNVKLDRDTKRRLKLAAFNTETSMQAIMERAIRHYLDCEGF